MKREHVEEVIMNLLMAIGNNEQEIRQAKNLGSDLHMDSLDCAGLLMSSEHACGIRIEEEDVADLINGSFDNYCNYVTSKQKPNS